LSKLGENPYDPTVTPDELTLVYATLGLTTRGLELAKRADRDASFATVDKLVAVNSGAVSASPYLVGSRVLYFDSGRTGASRLFVARADADGGFGAAALVEGTNRPGWQDSNPVVADDELTIYFASASPETEVYRARRARTDAPFAGIERIAELSALGEAVRPMWLSPDQCTLYYARAPIAEPYNVTLYVGRKP
jgi:hypothetical protein